IPYFGAEGYASPHSIVIKHPGDMSCLVSGQKISSQSEGEYTRVEFLQNYTSVEPAPPSFACDSYQVMSVSRNDYSLEFLTLEGETMTEELVENMLDGIFLYTETMGDIGIRHYQIGFVDLGETTVGATPRRDTIFVRSSFYHNLDTDFQEKTLFLSVIFHEMAHLWNGFVQGDTWMGGNEYFLFYQEGGANFLSTWACGQILGTDAEIALRKDRLQRMAKFKHNESPYNLKYVPNIFPEDLSWVGVAYEYAGMIWEQLRLKIGHQALFDGLIEFTQEYWLGRAQGVDITDLFDTIEKYTEIDVEDYLAQWSTHNAVIELRVGRTRITKTGDTFESQIIVNVDADGDYEIFTSIGYQTDEGAQLVDVHFTEAGSQTVTFTSDQRPTNIVIDPEYRVPRLIGKDTTEIIQEIIAGTLILAVFGTIVYFTLTRIRRRFLIPS
ncbi:MAG: M1 family aminopeptidase, partial [Candidatus Kariarchaeaceae archaeon]